MKKEAYYCTKKNNWCMNEMYDCPEIKYGIYPGCGACPHSRTREYIDPIKPMFFE